MLKSVRHDRLLSLVQARGHASVQEVIEALGVSPATARRDIAELGELGHLERTWGGVRLAATEDDPFQETLAQSGAAKQKIAREAASRVPDGSSVILDIGTSVHYVALALAEKELTVITASLPVFEHLRTRPSIRITLLGGRWSERYQCFDGQHVIDALDGYHADYAFLGCSGLSDAGTLRDTTASQAAIKRRILERATHTYLLADHAKFPGKGVHAAGNLGSLTGLVTDLPTLSEPLTELCRSQHTEVFHA